jgi:hypothetical protein
MSRIVVVLAVLLAVLVPVPGQAVFHFANIDELMSGKGGDSTAQYVEIRMLQSVQGSVAHSLLTAFSCDGSTHTILLEVPDNVCPAIMNGRWTMGTASWAAATGVTPDFIFPASAAFANGCGMICWGADSSGFTPPPNPPTWNAGVPDNYNPDCVAYGGYTGTRQTTDTAASTLTAGNGTQSLQRMADTSNDSADFAFATPTPTNNGTCPTTTTTTSTTTTTVPGQSASKCTAKEFAAAGKKAGKKAKCQAKVIAKNDTSSLSACNGAAEMKFGMAFGKATAKMDCINPPATAGDVETTVDNFMGSLTSQLAGASTGPSKCTSKELSAAGKLASSEASCHGKSIGKGDPTTIAGCVSTAKTKFETAYGGAMAKMDCINPAVMASDVEGTVNSFISNLNGQLAP